MSEPSDWSKTRAMEITEHHVCGTDDCCGLYTDYAAKIASALEEAAQRERWEPIATAPKDGTWVLVWREGRQYVARWIGHPWFCWGVSVEAVPGEGDGAFQDIGPRQVGGIDSSGEILAHGPAYWQPLPKAPDSQRGAA